MTALRAVEAQYEALPYPPRNPQDELRRMVMPLTAHLPLANHVLWRGTRSLAGLRVLDAGCGTGDATVFIAHQLAASGGSVVALDISSASLAIARERAEIRGLDNIRFIQSEIESLPGSGLGPFDLIISSGVLHHLPSPEAGLAALSGVLAPGGGLAVMVYALHGRQHIYQAQQLLRLIAPPSLPPERRIAIARDTLSGIRPQHWVQLGRGSWSPEIEMYGDAGLFDLFLHAQDRAYTVPQIYEWLAGASLDLVRWDMPRLYAPQTYNDRLDVSTLDERSRHEAAELLNGRMTMHTFYAAPAADPRTAVDPLTVDAVPTWLLVNAADTIQSQLRDRRELEMGYSGTELRLLLDPFTRALLRRVDGLTPLGDLLGEMCDRFKLKRGDAEQRWLHIYHRLETFNLLGLFAQA